MNYDFTTEDEQYSSLNAFIFTDIFLFDIKTEGESLENTDDRGIYITSNEKLMCGKKNYKEERGIRKEQRGKENK